MPVSLRTRLRSAFVRRLERLPAFEIGAGRRVLVIAPHPDDETLACGGLIAAVLEAGGSAQVLVLADGAGGPMGRALGGAQAARVRAEEVRAACRRLGLPADALTLAALPDGRLADHEDFAAARIGNLVRGWQPDLVAFPLSGEGHPDHEATNRGARAALSAIAFSGHVLEYPVWRYNTWPWVRARPRRVFRAPRSALAGLRLARELTVRVPLSPEAARAKLEALALHASQVRDTRWATLADAGSGELLAYFQGDDEYFRHERSTAGALSVLRAIGGPRQRRAPDRDAAVLSAGARPHVLVFAPPRFTGGSVAIARALAAGLADEGWRVSTAGSVAPGSPGPRVGRRKHGLAWRVRRALRDAAALWHAVRQGRPDLVSIHVGGPQAMAVCAVAARLAGARHVVVTLHGSGDRPRWNVARRLAARLVNAIAVPSAAERDRHVDAGLPAHRVVVIPNGVATLRLPERAAARSALEIPGDACVVACVARLVPEKDVASLLEATASLAGLRVIVAGDGPARPDLQRQASARPDVRFLGWLAGGPAELLAAADIFVLPSRRESFGLVYVEAALAGLPAVAWDVPAVDETIADGDTGLLVPIGDVAGLRDAIARLRDDAHLRARMGAAARARATGRFSLGAMVALYRALFEDVLASSDAPPASREM